MGKLVYTTSTPCGYFLDRRNAESFRDMLVKHGYHPIIESITDVSMNVHLIRDYYGKRDSVLERKFELIYKVDVQH